MLIENGPWEGDKPIRLELVQNLSRAAELETNQNPPLGDDELGLDL